MGTSRIFWLFAAVLLLVRIYLDSQVKFSDGDRVRVEGRVGSEVTVYDYSQMVRLGRWGVFIPPYPRVGYGDLVVIEGEFVGGEIERAKVVRLEKATSALVKLRTKLVDFYSLSLPEPHNALVAGIVLGSKQTMPSWFWEELKTSGTAHVVVASGMNVTLVAKFFMVIWLAVLPRRKAILAALGGIWLYT